MRLVTTAAAMLTLLVPVAPLMAAEMHMKDSLKGVNKVKVEVAFNVAASADKASALNRDDITNLITANVKAAGLQIVVAAPDALVRVTVNVPEAFREDGKTPLAGVYGVRVDLVVRQDVVLVRNNRIKILADTWWMTKSTYRETAKIQETVKLFLEKDVMKEFIQDRKAANP